MITTTMILEVLTVFHYEMEKEVTVTTAVLMGGGEE
jgi:hypothetical protein